jgi:hypothetical protein
MHYSFSAIRYTSAFASTEVDLAYFGVFASDGLIEVINNLSNAIPRS